MMRRIVLLSLFVCCAAGCQKPGGNSYPHGPASAEPMLRRASGACLARIVRLQEKDDRPADGDHYVEAWLELTESSGTIPDYLTLVIEHGGHMPFEAIQELSAREDTMVLRHDSLKVGQLHWFVFSEDYDSSKFPHAVAGWWRYQDGDVPADVVEAVQQDRFADHPVWDKTLNVVYGYTQSAGKIRVRVCKGDSVGQDAVIFDQTVDGTLESVHLSHTATTYEIEWPDDDGRNLVHIATVGELSVDNAFQLPPDRYRISYAYDLATGRRIAAWVAKNQQSRVLLAFHQYDLRTGSPIREMDFMLMPTGGIEAGGDKPQWYRRRVRRYRDGLLLNEKTYRYADAASGTQRIDSGLPWVAVEDDEPQPQPQP